MPAGLTVINDNGRYQIDENSFCWTVIHNSLLDSEAGSNSGSFTRVTKTFTWSGPQDTVFALYVPAGAGVYSDFVGNFHNLSWSGGVWTIEIVIGRDLAIGGSTFDITGLGIRWFALNRPATPATFGLNVYDAAGNLQFTSHVRSKAPVTPTGNPAHKFASLAARAGYTHEFDVYDVSGPGGIEWWTDEVTRLPGYRSNGGNVIFDDPRVSSETYTSAGGTPYSEVRGVDQPTFFIDVTELA